MIGMLGGPAGSRRPRYRLEVGDAAMRRARAAAPRDQRCVGITNSGRLSPLVGQRAVTVLMRV